MAGNAPRNTWISTSQMTSTADLWVRVVNKIVRDKTTFFWPPPQPPPRPRRVRCIISMGLIPTAGGLTPTPPWKLHPADQEQIGSHENPALVDRITNIISCSGTNSQNSCLKNFSLRLFRQEDATFSLQFWRKPLHKDSVEKRNKFLNCSSL